MTPERRKLLKSIDELVLLELERERLAHELYVADMAMIKARRQCAARMMIAEPTMGAGHGVEVERLFNERRKALREQAAS